MMTIIVAPPQLYPVAPEASEMVEVMMPPKMPPAPWPCAPHNMSCDMGMPLAPSKPLGTWDVAPHVPSNPCMPGAPEISQCEFPVPMYHPGPHDVWGHED